MKKIMFNDKYGLTQAVLEGRKTITRRAIPIHDYKYGFQVYYDRETKQCCVCDGSFIVERSRYARGEVVAIAQSYNEVLEEWKKGYGQGIFLSPKDKAGMTNKMFVRADDMPHHIKITNIRAERLQDISDEDCLREGLIYSPVGVNNYGFYSEKDNCVYYFYTPREAFAALIDKVSGKGTWDSNPLVWVYEFELEKE